MPPGSGGGLNWGIVTSVLNVFGAATVLYATVYSCPSRPESHPANVSSRVTLYPAVFTERSKLKRIVAPLCGPTLADAAVGELPSGPKPPLTRREGVLAKKVEKLPVVEAELR